MRRLIPFVMMLLLLLAVGCARTPATSGTVGEATSTPLVEATATPLVEATFTALIEATSTPPMEPKPTAAAEELPETLFIYTREGGFAGFCDSLTVHADEAIVEHCGGQSSLVALDEQTRAELEALARRYAATSLTREDNPGGPDSLKETLDFRGIGSEEPTEEVLNRLRILASDLILQAVQP